MKKLFIKIYEKIKSVCRWILRSVKTPQIPINKDGKVFINVGCGNDSGPEFINIDVLKLPNIHHIHDITHLPMFEDESADMIYASHVIEHLPKDKLVPTLEEWKRVLKKGGIFRFAVPDFDKLIAIYEGSGKDVATIRDQVMGQMPPYDNHYTLWNFKYAQKIMNKAGFVNIRKWSPETVDHHDFKDRSSRSINGIFFSLNLEVEKP